MENLIEGNRYLFEQINNKEYRIFRANFISILNTSVSDNNSNYSQYIKLTKVDNNIFAVNNSMWLIPYNWIKKINCNELHPLAYTSPSRDCLTKSMCYGKVRKIIGDTFSVKFNCYRM